MHEIDFFDSSKEEISATISPAQITAQLNQILDSPEFRATPSQRKFLQFVVSFALAGKSDDIKGFTVATQALGRGDDFDQANDPIVSIQAGKLRRALERYYLTGGNQDMVHITIPKGTYVPVFSQSINTNTKVRHGRRITDYHPDESWPTILVRPFLNFTGDKNKDFLGTGFATEIATEISRFQEIPVLLSEPEKPANERQNNTFQFVIDGSIRSDRDAYKINFALSDATTQKILWSDSRRCDNEISSFINLQEEVAQIAAATIAGECGIIHRKLSSERKQRPPAALQTYEAILHFYDYEQTLSSESFMVALRALEQAKELKPHCGLIWSFLARMNIDIYSLEISGFDIYAAKKKAILYADMSVHFNPDNQRSHAVLAFVRLITDELAAARREIDLAYSLNHGSLFILDAIGYIMTLLGDWERGPRVIREAINRNPYYKPIVHYGLWLDCLNRRDFAQAYQETLLFRRPTVFWHPLAKAATLGLLGRGDEGKEHIGELLELQSDFVKRGKMLIRKFIKFKTLEDLVVQGLSNCGLEMDLARAKK